MTAPTPPIGLVVHSFTRFPAEQLLVTGRNYARGANVVDGKLAGV